MRQASIRLGQLLQLSCLVNHEGQFRKKQISSNHSPQSQEAMLQSEILERERERERETDRQTDRQTETDRETERQTDRQTDRDRERETDRDKDRDEERDNMCWHVCVCVYVCVCFRARSQSHDKSCLCHDMHF